MTPLAQAIVAGLRAQPRQFAEVADLHRDARWPEFLRAWGEVRALPSLTRDEDGRYVLCQESGRKANDKVSSSAVLAAKAMSLKSGRMTAANPRWRPRISSALSIRTLFSQQTLHLIEEVMAFRFWPSN